MTTSQKHRNFVSEPMGDKSVTLLAGIGDVLGTRLIKQGYDKAYLVLAQYLAFRKNRERFILWISGVCGANAKQANDCYMCLAEWCHEFL